MMITKEEIIHAYNMKNGWGIDKQTFVLFALLHAEGNEKTRDIIEELLTDINFHSEVGLFRKNKHSEAICNR